MTEPLIPSTRFFEAKLSAAESQAFDALVEQSGLAPNEVGEAILAFVCRSLSGLREANKGDIESFLADEFGDLKKLMERIGTATSRAETAIEASRSMTEMLSSAVISNGKN
jgi:hypothetical protein